MGPKWKFQGRFSFMSPIKYMLREQRLLCFFVGIAIPALLFNFIAPLPSPPGFESISNSFVSTELTHVPRRITYELHDQLGHMNAGIVTKYKIICFTFFLFYFYILFCFDDENNGVVDLI